MLNGIQGENPHLLLEISFGLPANPSPKRQLAIPKATRSLPRAR
jgi:hypothetical protein